MVVVAVLVLLLVVEELLDLVAVVLVVEEMVLPVKLLAFSTLVEAVVELDMVHQIQPVMVLMESSSFSIQNKYK